MTGWPALAAARAHDATRRVPFVIDGHVVGSVARAHLAALRAWSRSEEGRGPSDVLQVTDAGVTLVAAPTRRNADLARLNARLHADGLVVGWRDEPYVVVRRPGDAPLAIIERAAARFWGTLTFGAHANGFVADARARPTHLWIAQRALTKQTDPGLFDNMVGGGVPAGQSPLATLVREGWEEAGLTPAQMASATPGRVMRLHRDIAEGFQHEWLYAFDLTMPHGLVPRNQDGEVAGFELLPVADAIAIAATERMTVDASLVTLDFALRHGLIAPDHFNLQSQLQPLLVDPALTR